MQLDIVAVLCLLALFTNEHFFWFSALILAFIDLPDFLTPVTRIAKAVESIAGTEVAESTERAEAKSDHHAAARHPGAKGPPMLELMMCSILTLLPDFLIRRFVQGKRIGREITLFSVW